MGCLKLFPCSDKAENHQSASLNSRTETEGKDRAYALLPKGKYTVGIGREPKSHDDKQLVKAKARPVSLIVGSHPKPRIRNESGNGYGHDNLYEPITFPYSARVRICVGCNTEIDHEGIVEVMNAFWHQHCFSCCGCNQPIYNNAFLISGSGFLCHEACYNKYPHPKCDVCQHFIPRNAAGDIEYVEHPFWLLKYCPSHERDGTLKCCSCQRIESQDVKFALLNDGRKLCWECERSATMGSSECQPLSHEMHEFFKSLNMKFTQDVSLVLVRTRELNQLMGGVRGERHRRLLGLCIFEERTVTTIPGTPMIRDSNRVMCTKTEPYIRGHREVAIYILYGLPRLQTGRTLAHEMMHAWFGLNGYPKLRDEVEEGICEVIAYMWLESQIVSMSDKSNASTSYSASTPFEKNLCKFFKHQTETNPDVVYGDGFRAAHESVIKFGLPKTLDHIKKTGNLPS